MRIVCSRPKFKASSNKGILDKGQGVNIATSGAIVEIVGISQNHSRSRLGPSKP
jgi:hypothetical protein